MIKNVSQREALELMIDTGRKLLESTSNPPAKELLDTALAYLGQIRFHLTGNDLYDPILLRGSRGNTVNVELKEK